MEHYTYLRNDTDLSFDGKLCERRVGQSFDGPIIKFGSYTMYAKDRSRIYQFGEEEVLLGLFLGHALYAGRI